MTSIPSINNCDSSNKSCCFIRHFDRISYSDALAIQHNLHDRCASNNIPSTLILLEHDPVITMGVKSSSHSNVLVSPEVLKAKGIEIVETDRGGDVTYHGPGQLVGYPIVRVRDLARDVHDYLRKLEQTVIDTLAYYNLEGERNGLAGVWVNGKKVCSIGIAMRRGVTYHGLALNVDPDLSHFQLINPCGLLSEQITSMTRLLGHSVDLNEIREAYSRAFTNVFKVTLIPWCDEE